ncbi:hypothetical protein C808_04193 [Lachnospiraceae bacterium M18-1]|nr:hypothetical protein C808_04193 [Lachnospiraceae bacterium M18-1]
MLKKIIWGTAALFMLGTIIVYFIKPGELFSSDNIFSAQADLTSGEENTLAEENKENMLSTDKGMVPEEQVLEGEEIISEENYYKMSESPVTRGIRYKVNSWRVTKEKGNFIIEPYMKWPEYQQADENGNMAGSYSYIILDVSIENVSDSVDEVDLMNNYIRIRSQDKITMEELRTFSGLDSGRGMLAATYPLEPGEKYEGELAYTVSDELLQDSSYEYFIRPSGIIGYNEDTRYIKLE